MCVGGSAMLGAWDVPVGRHGAWDAAAQAGWTPRMALWDPGPLTQWNNVPRCGTAVLNMEHVSPLWNTFPHCGTSVRSLEHVSTMWNSTVETWQ
jgi:hypothetical protein